MINSIFLCPVTETKIINIVNSFKPKTSFGHDGICNKVLKHCINGLSSPLCKIFNKSFSNGIYPDAMKISKIIPIFKTGDKSDIKNYRPISLQPVISKIFEKLMLCRLSSFCNSNNILDSHQHGFRFKHSTTTALIELLDFVTNSLDKKIYVLTLFMDISKISQITMF